jgi:membrane-anchored protein YejM (alkaline phosphatase superfamily)
LVWHAAVLPRAEAAALHRWLFVRLWLATVAPAGLIDFMSGRDAFGFAALDMRSLRNQRVSVLTQPVTTLLSFERYLDHESRLPARGRYTLVHLLVPHSPFVLAPDCTHRDIRSATNELDQSRCAVRLIRRLLDRLDQLGRLRDSIVLIQSDHGSFTERPGHTPEDYPALLLLKPQHASGPLRRVNTAVSLLDVTPTLLGLLGLEASPLYQGRTLLDAGPRPSS